MSDAEKVKSVLFILTSHDKKGETDQPTGFYLAEAAHPWAILSDAGINVEFASIAGGQAPIDGLDLLETDPVCQRFMEDPEVKRSLLNTADVGVFEPEKFDAVLYVGGHGTMWDFPDDKAQRALAERVWQNGGLLAAVCHGPAGLVNLRDESGDYIVSGRKLAAFTDEEEQAVGLADVVPFLLASRLCERGALHQPAENWAAQVVTDGRLITGQNPASAVGVGQALRDALLASV